VSIRPVDLQQVVTRTTDVTREASTQQQAAASHQAQVADQTRRQAQQAETVQQFDEAGAVLVRDRRSGPGQQDQPEDQPKEEPAAEEEQAKGVVLSGGTARPPLGRHVDLHI
jgi:hypothetical protein